MVGKALYERQIFFRQYIFFLLKIIYYFYSINGTFQLTELNYILHLYFRNMAPYKRTIIVGLWQQKLYKRLE